MALADSLEESQQQQQGSFLGRHKKAIAALSVSLAVIVGVAVPLSMKSNNNNNLTSNNPNSIAKIKVDPSAESDPITTFTGDITEFIVTNEIVRQAMFGAQECPAGEGLWNLVLVTDDYPWETKWELHRKNNANVLAFGPPEGTNYARRTRYTGNMCLPPGQYYMTWKDLTGDGICCDYGPGEWTVQVNNEVVAQMAEGGDKSTQFDAEFSVTAAAPFNPVTPSPTAKPTPSPTTASIGLDGDYCVDIDLTTDTFGKETSWAFATKPEDGSDPVIIESAGKGPDGTGTELADSTDYSTKICVAEGAYTFTLYDDFGGLCCAFGEGKYSIKIDGEEVAQGGKFTEKSKVIDLLVGYIPTKSDKDLEWLDAHNIRREEYHNANNVEYKRLVWSPDLAERALDWATTILESDECKNRNEPGITEGENISVRQSNIIRSDEEVSNIMARWVDSKVNNPAEPFRQVMWRSTRYVGCADLFGEHSQGGYCYIHVCRYARAGNCNMNAYEDKMEPVLLDHTVCGPACPGEGCH